MLVARDEVEYFPEGEVSGALNTTHVELPRERDSRRCSFVTERFGLAMHDLDL